LAALPARAFTPALKGGALARNPVAPIEPPVQKLLCPDETVGRVGRTQRPAVQRCGVLVQIEHPVRAVRRPHNDVDPQVVDGHQVALVDDPHQVAVPPTLSLGRKHHGLADLEAVVKQHETALLARAAVPVETPIIRDHLAQSPAGRPHPPVADHCGGHRPVCPVVRHGPMLSQIDGRGNNPGREGH
jgi:hypothetical protein